jgi:putative nucleotidyltransferase with HDIG domain
MKPFSHAELERAVAAALDRAGRRERELKERLLTPTLASTLANAIEARDLGMEGHCERLAALAILIATRLELAAVDIETVRLGAILHDIGKICIPDRVLLKPGSLEEVEIALIRTHPIVGDRLLEPLDLVANVRPAVRHHHERWDGGGYPDGLAGGDIPLAARIVSVADAVEAMSARRPYREPLQCDAVVRELEDGRGTQWDPALIDLVIGFIGAGEVAFGPDGLSVTSAEFSRGTRIVPTVLLVEGDRDHATLAAMALQATLGDVRVVLAGAVEEALRLCAGSNWSVAVLGQRLPDGSGIDVLEILRRSDPDLPIIMLTGVDSHGVAMEAYRRGATYCMVKSPDYLDVLSNRIRKLLQAA